MVSPTTKMLQKPLFMPFKAPKRVWEALSQIFGKSQIFLGHLDHKKEPKTRFLFRGGIKSPPPYGRVKIRYHFFALWASASEVSPNRLDLIIFLFCMCKLCLMFCWSQWSILFVLSVIVGVQEFPVNLFKINPTIQRSRNFERKIVFKSNQHL